MPELKQGELIEVTRDGGQPMLFSSVDVWMLYFCNTIKEFKKEPGYKASHDDLNAVLDGSGGWVAFENDIAETKLTMKRLSVNK